MYQLCCYILKINNQFHEIKSAKTMNDYTSFRKRFVLAMKNKFKYQ